MKVGMTYDLRSEYLAMGYSEEETAEFDREETIAAIEGALKARGYSVDRIGHLFSLVGRLANGEKWDLVFNIAEGVRGFAREAQVPAALEAYGIAYTFSDPLVLSVALHKATTKRIVRSFGIPTPDFHVVSTPDDVSEVALEYPLFAKPIAEGTAKGITGKCKVADGNELITVCRDLLQRYAQPVLVERYLSGREFTVGILGTGDQARVLGVMEILPRSGAEANAYTYINKEQCEELITYEMAHDELAKEAAHVALASWKCLECRDAGRVDLRADHTGRINFIEVNPLAGLHPSHSDLPIICSKVGIAFGDLIGGIVDSALQRCTTV